VIKKKEPKSSGNKHSRKPSDGVPPLGPAVGKAKTQAVKESVRTVVSVKDKNSETDERRSTVSSGNS